MFKQIPLKPSYYTTTSDIVEEFYNPVLQIAISYDRVSGYFSSKALAAYAKGLKSLIHSGGKMRLIISQDISEEDFNLIKNGYDLRAKLTQELLEKLDEKLTTHEEVDFYNLAHLIAIGKADIKIGFKKSGLFHSKFGLVTDVDGNVIYFTGSNNETQAAIENNFESFDITTSWLCSDFDIQKLYRARQEFETLWDDQAQIMNVYVKDINEIIKTKIMSFDKGRLILDTEMLSDDALILTLNDDKLVLIDNLSSYTIKPTEFTVAQKLLPFFDEGYPNFKAELTYIEMKEVIKILERFSSRKNFKFIVSKSLELYLEQQAYWIEERSKYALLLKSQDEQIVDRFDKFSQFVSKEMIRTLRDKQMWSAFYMHQMKKAANFSVPGAGKTSMIYGVFAYLNSPEINEVDRIIMIGPKNTFLAWKQEFTANFGDKKELKLLDIHNEESPSLQLKVNSSSKNLILINYESLQNYENILLDIIDERTMLIFDEVHKIKGVKSKRAQVAKKIAAKPIYKYVLTGTPIPNTYEDIFNFLNILYTDEYKKFFNFKVNDLKNPDVLQVQKINDKLYPFFWRTTKTELQVPAANPDDIIKVPANPMEQEIIDLLYRKYGKDAFSLYIRLIQVSSNPELLLKSIDHIEMYGEEDKNSWYNNFEKEPVVFTEQEIELIRQVPTTSKYRNAVKLARDLRADGKQSIIWCMFVNTIDKVYSDLVNSGVKAAVIYGSTPQNDREEIIEAFKQNKIEVLITNPHTLAESVSLHKTCHDAIYLEYSFNLTHMLQSRDRIHRLGLKDAQYTQYYYFMLEGESDKRNTIDERIYNRLKEKEQRMLESIENGVLDPDPEVNYDEILSLFN